MSDRIILHCDCNGFFASVEMLSRPELAHVPMAVAGDPESRHGIILAKNEIAKGYGVKTAETIWQAKKKCPDLVLVPPHHEKYHEISRRVNAIYLDYTDLVDPFGIDESFLDVTGSMHLFPFSPRELADVIRARVKSEIGITISVGVSFCRVFAKLGSDYKKPDATTVISRENFKDIVYSLPVSDMLYVGRRTGEQLRALGVLTIGDLAAADPVRLKGLLGEAGEMLWRYANGNDHEPVCSYYERKRPKSVGNGMTFRRNIVGEGEIRAGVVALCDAVAARLREENCKCTVVQVQVKSPDFRTVQRQKTLRRATWLQRDLVENAMQLIKEANGYGNMIRALTVTASGLVGPNETEEQLDMFAVDDVPDKREGVEDALHAIRKRFGRSSIRLGYYRQPDSAPDDHGEAQKNS
ncbi:MAG: DNA polymerase IV [Clostridia bacterium]|nr:DNA polymerase IV [Clostridia bacterium]